MILSFVWGEGQISFNFSIKDQINPSSPLIIESTFKSPIWISSLNWEEIQVSALSTFYSHSYKFLGLRITSKIWMSQTLCTISHRRIPFLNEFLNTSASKSGITYY